MRPRDRDGEPPVRAQDRAGARVLLEIFAESCNYEILQWQNMYYKQETWPLPEIFPKKFTCY